MVILDKISKGAHYVSFIHSADIQNGIIIELGAIKTDDYETFTGRAVTATTGQGYVLHASVPLNYTTDNTVDFTLEAGEEGRGIILQVGDIFTTADTNIDGETTAGEYVELDISAIGMVAVADPTVNDTDLQFMVIEKTTKFGVDCSVLIVTKAA
jgi:hypothetical protein